MNTNQVKLSSKLLGRFNLMVSSGSIRAILAGTGAGLACQMAQLDSFATIGGVSGGSIPTLLLAAKIEPKVILDKIIELDFADLVPARQTLGQFFLSWLKPKDKRSHAYQGLRTSAPLGEFMESLVPVWPDNYWTVAARNGNPVLFTSKGVFEYQKGKVVQVKTGRPSVSHAIRASCAIPGIIEAVDYEGMRLFDGGYSVHGGMPCELVCEHFGKSLKSVLAIDFTNCSKDTFLARGLMYLSRCISNHMETEFHHEYLLKAAAVISPKLAWLTGRLPLKLSIEQKENAIMEGFREAYYVLKLKGLLPEQTADKLGFASLSFDNLRQAVSTSPNVVANASWFPRLLSQGLETITAWVKKVA